MSDQSPVISPKHPVPLHTVAVDGKFIVQQPPGNQFEKVSATRVKPIQANGKNFPKGSVKFLRSLMVYKYT